MFSRAQFIACFLKTVVLARTVSTMLFENGILAREVFTILFEPGALARAVFTVLLQQLQATGCKLQAAGHQ